jgi:hypothetical protein
MANEKILNTRVQLKYDSYENWSKTDIEGQGANLILKAGEIGICTIPAKTEVDGVKNPPHVMIKVGDGVTPFSGLNWLSAPAVDVADWAKADEIVLIGEKLTFKKFGSDDAIYEVDLSDFATDAVVGDLTKLNTTVKSDLVTAINEVLTAVGTGGTDAVVTIDKLETPTEGSAATYQLYQGGKPVGDKVEIPVSTKVEVSE